MLILGMCGLAFFFLGAVLLVKDDDSDRLTTFFAIL